MDCYRSVRLLGPQPCSPLPSHPSAARLSTTTLPPKHLPNVQGTPLVEIEDGPCGMLSFARTLISLKYCHTEDNRNLSTESDLRGPALPVNLDEHPPNIHGTPVKSFLERLNSNDDDYNNHAQAGGSLIFLSAQYTVH